MHYDERLHFYLPDHYRESLHDTLVNPSGASAASSLIGTAVLRKTLDPTTWIIGNNTIATVAGGALQIEALSLRVLTTFTSGGAPTLDIQDGSGVSLLTATAVLAQLAQHNVLGHTPPGGVTVWQGGAAGDIATTPKTSTGQFSGPLILTDNQILRAVVATALYTGGSMELVIIYTPLTAGANLS